MTNLPSVKVGIVVGSTDWMPAEIAIEKRKQFVSKYVEIYGDSDVYEVNICLNDNEINIKRIMKELIKAECTALCIYWANYGPESSGTLLAEAFEGPVMMMGAGEETANRMQKERTDALSGFINACFALDIRNTNVYIPPKPVGNLEHCLQLFRGFFDIARVGLAIKSLKVITIGPRPNSYMASEVSLRPLFRLGLSIDEYSELEVYDSYNKHAGDARIDKIMAEMAEEMSLSETNNYIEKYAQYEVTINDWVRGHTGNSKYVTMTSTCWPAFPISFGFVPCYVNSRLTGKGIPVACEVDVYGAVSEYIGQCISDDIVTILNINNDLPKDIYDKDIKDKDFSGKKYALSDVFLGYHCGVTSSQKLDNASLQPHFVNNQLIGEEKSQGTIQGRLIPGGVTLFRIQDDANGGLMAYVLQGQVLPVDAGTYGGYGVIAVPEMERFVRNVVMEKHFPNHAAVIWGLYGEKLVATLRLLGITTIYYNKPKNIPYENENVFNVINEWY